MLKINQCLWFDNQAEEASQFYTSVFKNSKVGRKARYGKSAAAMSGQKVTDKFGVSWQIVPTIVGELAADKDTKKADRVMKALFEMKKLDLKTLLAAAQSP